MPCNGWTRCNGTKQKIQLIFGDSVYQFDSTLGPYCCTIIVDESTRSVSTKTGDFPVPFSSSLSRLPVCCLQFWTDPALSYRHVVPSPVNNQNRNVNTVRHNVNNVSTFFPLHHTITNISAGKIC